jgi:hypothetical protein
LPISTTYNCAAHFTGLVDTGEACVTGDTVGFLLLPVESREYSTSCTPITDRATQATTKTRQSYTFNQQEARNIKKESEKQILIGQIVRSIN